MAFTPLGLTLLSAALMLVGWLFAQIYFGIKDKGDKNEEKVGEISSLEIQIANLKEQLRSRSEQSEHNASSISVLQSQIENSKEQTDELFKKYNELNERHHRLEIKILEKLLDIKKINDGN